MTQKAVIELASGSVFFTESGEDYAGGGYAVLEAPEDYQSRPYAWDGESLVPDDALAWSTIRKRRDERLRACDWAGLADVPSETAAPWLDYRQALRDLPENTVDPWSPDWPTPPAG